ncbi:hypothetical protein OIU78_028077 [Salix suchowensis]|nr:hypothetical protein OIU78_028077 [Salix suchowensis]
MASNSLQSLHHHHSLLKFLPSDTSPPFSLFLKPPASATANTSLSLSISSTATTSTAYSISPHHHLHHSLHFQNLLPRPPPATPLQPKLPRSRRGNPQAAHSSCWRSSTKTWLCLLL